MLKEKARTISGMALAVDLTTIALSFAIATTISRHTTTLVLSRWLRRTLPFAEEPLHQYALLLLISMAAWMAVALWRGSYRSHRSEHLWPFLLGHWTTQLLWLMGVGTLAFVLKLNLVSRTFFLTFLPLSSALLTARQLGVRSVLQVVRSRGHNIRRVIVLGESSRAREFSQFIEHEGGPGYKIIPLSARSHGRLNGNLKVDFDEAFLALGDENGDLADTVLELAKLGKRVHLVPGLFDGRLFRQSLEEFAGVPVLSIGGPRLDPIDAAVKRVVDIVGASILLLVLSPVLLLSALLVKLSSPGPILFSQERLSRNGRRFRMLKFRTMYRDAEERLRADPELLRIYLENHHKVPANADPRIAPFGRFLRKASLDELPQLFNVLQGHMSLVGPRPVTPPQLEQYGDYSSLLLSVKPGVTGNWQIHGRSEITDFARRAALDIEYIRDQSLRTDVDILLKTIPAVLRGKGAQ